MESNSWGLRILALVESLVLGIQGSGFWISGFKAWGLGLGFRAYSIVGFEDV